MHIVPRSRIRLALAALLAVCSVVLSVPPASASSAAAPAGAAVIEWNRNAETAIVQVGQQQPDMAAVSFAMVHGAIFDAVNAIDRGYQPYLVSTPASPLASRTAAVASAAYQVLVDLFPAQQASLQLQYQQSLSGVADGYPKRAGIAAGRRAAAAMLAARENDGRDGQLAWREGTAAGEWRPTPPYFFSSPATIARVKPFLISDVARFRSAGPLDLTSAQYAEEYAEARDYGGVVSANRTADQTDAAVFWSGRGMDEQILRSIAQQRGMRTADTARMFAMAYLTTTDAVIACFDDKYAWSFWRPVTAIAAAADDGNPATQADASWTPLLMTPPFPEHSSAHACAHAAFTTTLRHILRTDAVAFRAFSSASGTTREYDSLSDLLTEVNNARIWGGVHFRTAQDLGTTMGNEVASWSLRRFLRPCR